MIKWIVRAALLWLIQRLAREYMEPGKGRTPARKRRPQRR